MSATNQVIRTDALGVRNRKLKVRRGGKTFHLDLTQAPQRVYEVGEPPNVSGELNLFAEKRRRRAQMQRTTQTVAVDTPGLDGQTLRVVDDYGSRYVDIEAEQPAAPAGDAVVYVEEALSTSLFWVQVGTELLLSMATDPDPNQLFLKDGDNDITPVSIHATGTDSVWTKDGEDLVI